jgi:hypothetical protein
VQQSDVSQRCYEGNALHISTKMSKDYFHNYAIVLPNSSLHVYAGVE